MNAPRLSIGLPVYNGAAYLEDALDSLLNQTFTDFELIISDNASTDATPAIVQSYAAADPRIRYIRQPEGIGVAGNHNVVFAVSRGEYFKWASDDDLYDPDMIRQCIAVLDEHPDVVLASAWTAIFDGPVEHARAVAYGLRTGAPRASDRFRSMLVDNGGDDDYGVIRAAVLRKVRPYGSYFNADRMAVTELGLHGPFRHIPDWMYFRRDHPTRISAGRRDARQWCTAWDARRANRWRHPKVRLFAEYVLAYVGAIRRTPLPLQEQVRCYFFLSGWLVSRVVRRLRNQQPVDDQPLISGRFVPLPLPVDNERRPVRDAADGVERRPGT